MNGRRRQATRWIVFALGAVLLGVATMVSGIVVVGLFLSSPAPATVGMPPADLKVEPVTLSSPSGSTLHGWFIAGRPGGGAVVPMHGVRANRLSMMRRARLLNADGFAVFLFDFQAHGESQGSRITFGRLESLDAESAIGYVRKRLPEERVGAIGCSLGGAAVLLVPGPLRIDALVLEAVYSDIRAAVANRIRAVLGPIVGTVIAPPVAWLFETILSPLIGVDPRTLRPIDRMATVTAPVMIANGTRDDRTTITEARAMLARASMPTEFWAVDGAGHIDLEAFAPQDYRRNVMGFLAKHLQGRSLSFASASRYTRNK